MEVVASKLRVVKEKEAAEILNRFLKNSAEPRDARPALNFDVVHQLNVLSASLKDRS